MPRKRAVVAELSSLTKPHPSVSKLLMLLAERDRLVLLPALLDAYRARLLDHQGVVRAHITTAAPLAADRTQAIERNLARVTGRTVTVQTKVDPSIIGGVVTRVGSTVYDGSIYASTGEDEGTASADRVDRERRKTRNEAGPEDEAWRLGCGH